VKPTILRALYTQEGPGRTVRFKTGALQCCRRWAFHQKAPLTTKSRSSLNLFSSRPRTRHGLVLGELGGVAGRSVRRGRTHRLPGYLSRYRIRAAADEASVPVRVGRHGPRVQKD
jgi:hypothetical protein